MELNAVPQPDPSLEVHSLSYPKLPDAFYADAVREILPFCGNEYSTNDFHSALRHLNARLNLELTERQQLAFGLILTGLSQASRFQSSLHIDPALGENSAVHSLHTMILLDDFYRRAGLDAETEGAIRSQRRDVKLGGGLHDCGEILFELNTADQRAMNSQLREDHDIEAKIFEASLRMAFRTISPNGDDKLPRAYEFYDRLHQIRQEGRALVSKMDYLGLAQLVDTWLETERRLWTELKFSSEVEGEFADLLRIYTVVESTPLDELSQPERFARFLVKCGEHSQGTRHLTRFSPKAEGYEQLVTYSPYSSPYTQSTKLQSPASAVQSLAVPLAMSDSFRTMYIFGYLGGEVGDLFVNASAPHELALAKVGRFAAYATMIESLHGSGRYIDRGATEMNPYVAGVTKLLNSPGTSIGERAGLFAATKALMKIYHEKLEKEYFAQPQQPLSGDTLPRIVRNTDLMNLYFAAITRDYRPASGEILGRGDIIPEKLRGFEEIDWSRFVRR